MRLSRFTGYVVLAGFVWASYATLLGFVFGRRFQEDHTLAFLFAFGSAIVLVALAELIRWMLSRRQGGPSDSNQTSQSINVG